MNDLISLVVVDQEPRVDSRLIASQLGVDHKNTRELIERYQIALGNFGKVPFETEASGKTNQSQKFYLLNEDQSYLLLTLTRNTDQAVELKIRLVRVFGEHRRRLANPQPQPQAWIRRPIRCRDDLSFTRRDDAGRLTHWAVMHFSRDNWHISFGEGQAYFAQLRELASYNREEARLALQYALVEGAATNWPKGAWGQECGFAQALAEALFPDEPRDPVKKLPRKAKAA